MSTINLTGDGGTRPEDRPLAVLVRAVRAARPVVLYVIAVGLAALAGAALDRSGEHSVRFAVWSASAFVLVTLAFGWWALCLRPREHQQSAAVGLSERTVREVIREAAEPQPDVPPPPR